MKSKQTSVLVIESHPMMRESLCNAIAAEADLKVVEPAAFETNAFELEISSQYDVLYLTRKPDIILLSLGNSGVDDLQALTNLRKKLFGTPILALTRNEFPEQDQAALEHGAYAVITKSASRKELVQALRSIRTSSSQTRKSFAL
jgi:DNA-binding NarL/FixJ family response regulator